MNSRMHFHKPIECNKYWCESHTRAMAATINIICDITYYLCIASNVWKNDNNNKCERREREGKDRIFLSIHHFQFKSFINGNLELLDVLARSYKF